MAYNRSKSKGSSYERKVARQFSQWWSGDDKSIYRVSGSGSRKSSLVYGGDLQPVNDKATPWNLCVEIKKSEQWSIENFFNLNPGEPLLKYMIQCLQSASLGCNERAMLICAKNHKKPLCFLHYHGFCGFKGTKHALGRIKNYDVQLEDTAWSYPVVDFYVMHLDMFFNSFHRKDFI